ncbi:uncharacterized protein LOC117303251 [Asterias rubens]|uniref:uncharacterized protein LOC117303251 n=1 Tax=Asterias rubens TaxID=7604 RepID=UPI001455844E|nr:uncharacterized protein LOC117303251 [Asterias rubens]XP_033643297.1 uncharacterized protein LOC117303251 [Asterias rubens]
MDLAAVIETLGHLNTAQLAQLRNHLLSQDVSSLGLSADQAMGLLQAIEEHDTRAAQVQPKFVPSQPAPSFPVAQQPPDLDMPKVIDNINRLFTSAFGTQQGGADNSVGYQSNSELSAINERVQMLEMQRARILNAQKQEQQGVQVALGDGNLYTGPNPKRRMISNDGMNFNAAQGFQGNWPQGGNQMSQSALQINQPRAKMNQSGGGQEMNQPRGGAKANRGGFTNAKKNNRTRRKRGRGGQQRRSPGRSPGRSEPRGDSYGRRSPDDHYDRRSRSRESGGRDRRDNSSDRGRSYGRRSQDRDRRDDSGYRRGRREGSRNRDLDSQEKKYHDDDYGRRSDDNDNRSYQGERWYQDDRRSCRGDSPSYPDSPRRDGYSRSESIDFARDDQFDDGSDRQGQKRKHRDFDEGSWHADGRPDQEPPRRYSQERDYPDPRFSDGDQPRRGEGLYQEPPFNYGTKREHSRERDKRRWDDDPKVDVLDTFAEIEARWRERDLNRQQCPGDEFLLRQGDVLNPRLARATYVADQLLTNPPERRSLDLDLGRIQPIPLALGLGANRQLPSQPLANRLGPQVPRAGFPRGFSGPATPSRPVIPPKQTPVSAKMQGFPKRNQANLIKPDAKSFSMTRRVYQTQGDIVLVNLLFKARIPDKLPIKNLQNSTGANVKVVAGSVPPAGAPTVDQNKDKSKDVPAVGGGVAGKTLTKRPRPLPLSPEVNSIGNQCELLEALDLQGFLYQRVMTLWTCYICNTSLKNGAAYQIHIGSKNHIRTCIRLQTYEGALERRKVAFALRNLPNQRSYAPEQLNAGNMSRMFFCYECGEGYACKALEHRKTERHLTLEEYRKHCNLCNFYCRDMKALVKHQNSKLHIALKAIKNKDGSQVPGDAQNKTPIFSRTFVPTRVPVFGQKPVPNKAADSSRTPVTNKASSTTKSLPTRITTSNKLFTSNKSLPSNKPLRSNKPITSNKSLTSNKPLTPTKELSSDMTEGTAQPNISGLQSERKSIKVTLKGGKTPVTATDSGQEELIGLDLVIPVTGFFCRCCSKFYNNKFMAKRNHCMTAEHKQKALAWFKSHGTPIPQKKPGASNEKEAQSSTPKAPQPKPYQSETIIVIDDDDDSDDDIKETSKEKQQLPQRQDKTDTGEVTTQAHLGLKAEVNTDSEEDNGKMLGHAENSNDSSKIVKDKQQPIDRPVGRKLRAIRAQHQTKDSDLEDGEILSEEGELSFTVQSEASVEKMEAETIKELQYKREELLAAMKMVTAETDEQPEDKTEDLPAEKTEMGDVVETLEGTVDSTSAEMEVEASDSTVQESQEPSSETMEVMIKDQAIEETEDPLPSSVSDQNVKENVESDSGETEKPDLSVEETDITYGEVDNMDTVQSGKILEEPPIREMDKESDGPESDMTTEPPMELETGTTDLTKSSDAEHEETEIPQAEGEDLPSGGVLDSEEIEQPKEDGGETPADKDIVLNEDDLYANLVEHAPEAEVEESLEPEEEQGNEEREEEDDDDEDTRFFIDEGTWEVRSEEDGSNGEPFDDDAISERDEDDDGLVIIEDEENTSKNVEEKDDDVES